MSASGGAWTVEERHQMEVVDAVVRAGLIFAEQLPSLAATLLAEGADSPALRELAGADLDGFDAREVQDAYDRLAREANLASSPERQVELSAPVIAAAVISGRITVGSGLICYSNLQSADYDLGEEVEALIDLSYSYGALEAGVHTVRLGEGGVEEDRRRIENEARGIMERIAQRSPKPPDAVVSALGAARP